MQLTISTLLCLAFLLLVFRQQSGAVPTFFPQETESSSREFVCPPKSEMYPCSCLILSDGGHIFCRGPEVSQSTLFSVFATLRTVNLNSSRSEQDQEPGQGIPDEVLTLYSVTIEDTLLDKIDLSPLFGSKISELNIKHNPVLKVVGGPALSTKNLAAVENEEDEEKGHLVDAKEVTITYNKLLMFDGVKDLLQFFSRQMTHLTLSFTPDNSTPGNGVMPGTLVEEKGKDNRDRFLPGLSRLKNVTAVIIELEEQE